MNAEGSTRAIHETSLIARKLEGLQPYEPTWRAMQRFTAERTEATPDELWLLQHAPVYTLGLAGKPEHVLNPNGIEVVRIDRGGQVTYHGPGQLVAYVLLDLRRRGFGVKELVRRLEGAVIATLGEFAITGERQAGMPGVYVKGAKIAAVGLRVSRGCTYHGLSLNVDMDLQPFAGINPCGYAGLASTSMVAEGAGVTITTVQSRLAAQLEKSLCA